RLAATGWPLNCTGRPRSAVSGRRAGGEPGGEGPPPGPRTGAPRRGRAPARGPRRGPAAPGGGGATRPRPGAAAAHPQHLPARRGGGGGAALRVVDEAQRLAGLGGDAAVADEQSQARGRVVLDHAAGGVDQVARAVGGGEDIVGAVERGVRRVVRLAGRL